MNARKPGVFIPPDELGGGRCANRSLGVCLKDPSEKPHSKDVLQLWDLIRQFAQENETLSEELPRDASHQLRFNVQIAKTKSVALHRDSNDVGVQYIMTFGDYTGGRLISVGGDGTKTSLDPKNKCIWIDGRDEHYTEAFEGERYSLIIFVSWTGVSASNISQELSAKEVTADAGNAWQGEDFDWWPQEQAQEQEEAMEEQGQEQEQLEQEQDAIQSTDNDGLDSLVYDNMCMKDEGWNRALPEFLWSRQALGVNDCARHSTNHLLRSFLGRHHGFTAEQFNMLSTNSGECGMNDSNAIEAALNQHHLSVMNTAGPATGTYLVHCRAHFFVIHCLQDRWMVTDSQPHRGSRPLKWHDIRVISW